MVDTRDPLEFVLDSLPTSVDLTALQVRTWTVGKRFNTAEYVMMNGHPFVCILNHEATFAKKPDAGADAPTYWTRALLPYARYLVGSGTSGFRMYSTDGAAAPAARGLDSRLVHIRADVGDETTALTTGTTKKSFTMPFAMTLTSVRASLKVAQATGTAVTVDINEGAGTGTSILSTKLTIANTETNSFGGSATPHVISDTALADGARITIDIDAVDGATAAAGLKVTLLGYQVG